MALESFEKVTAVFSRKVMLALEVKGWKITHLALLVLDSTVINIIILYSHSITKINAKLIDGKGIFIYLI